MGLVVVLLVLRPCRVALELEGLFWEGLLVDFAGEDDFLTLDFVDDDPILGVVVVVASVTIFRMVSGLF